MIDIHSHILPAIDDGAKNIEEALEMCVIAVEDGIETIVATPHLLDGRYDHSYFEIANAVENLRRILKEKGLNLNILSGADIHAVPNLPEFLKRPGADFTLGMNGRYFLLEFPFDFAPKRQLEELVFEIMLDGFVPIITHPERCSAFQEDRALVNLFYERGALYQITAMSVTGDFGDEAEKCASYMLKRGLAHFIASDAHSAKRRKPVLSRAFKKIEADYGESTAYRLFVGNPKKAMECAYIESP